MAERGRSGQIKLPFREAVVTTSLRTGISEVRVRWRKRYPTPEQEYERAKKANDWWVDRGMASFHQSLRAWGFHQTDIAMEVGQSTEFASNAIEEAQASQGFLDSLIGARKLRIDPLEIVKRIKAYGSILRGRNAPESLILERFYPQVINLIASAYPRMAGSKREALLELLRHQKSLPNF